MFETPCKEEPPAIEVCDVCGEVVAS